MKIKQLYLKNFRGFEGEHSVVFHEKLPTVIVGVNGSGKTTIVDALFHLIKLHSLKVFSINNEETTFLESDISIGNELCSLEIDYFYSDNRNLPEGSLYSNYSALEGGITRGQIDEFRQQVEKILYGSSENLLPVFIYFPATRNTAAEEIRIPNDKIYGTDKRLNIFRKIYQDTIDFERITEWFIEQDNIQNKARVTRRNFNYTTPQFKFISNGFNSFLRSFSKEYLKIDTGTDYQGNQALVVEKSEKYFLFKQLSAGEKMLLGLVFETIYRMSIGNPKSDNPLLTDGIVLIDELELHLHPKWQANVLDALHQTFPNVQFIVTTHSPLVINNLKKEQLILIDDAKILQGDKIAEVYGKDAGWIIEYLMGAPTRPKEIEERISEIWGYLDDENLQVDKAKAKLAELRQIIDPNDSELLELDTVITLEETGDEIFGQG